MFPDPKTVGSVVIPLNRIRVVLLVKKESTHCVISTRILCLCMLGISRLWSVMGSEQVEAGFQVISELLDQEIRGGRPDLFKGRSGFKHQADST
jgi:hypothetical protein